MRYLLVVVSLSLGACAAERSMPPHVDEVKVEKGPSVPVLIPCDLDEKTKAERPNFVLKDDAELASIKDVEEGSRLYRALVKQLEFWVNKLEGGFEICRNQR